MRLTEKQLHIITTLFKKYFLSQDNLWLFGSRVDDTKKGGDIDLYIETHYHDLDQVLNFKSKFWAELQITLGEQKIDIVVKRLNGQTNLDIYAIARKEGIKLV